MRKLISAIPPFAVLLAALFLRPTVTLAQRPPDNQPDLTIGVQTKTQVINKLVQDLQEDYAFPDRGDNLAKMLQERQKNGDYNSITSAKDFTKLLTQQMLDIAHDRHLRIIYQAQGAARPVSATPSSPRTERKNTNNYEFEEVKRLDGNIGYVKVLGFNQDMDHAGAVAAGAMAFLANTDALIIDLLDNHGGGPGMVEFLASYFFDDAVHLSSIERRKPGTRDYNIEQYWTLPYVPGQRYLNKEVYILTSYNTFSAAEEFTYSLQALKRATIVGAATGGGANPGDIMPLAEHFRVFLPNGHSVNPITHTNWEGVGVQPDIAASPAEALKVAQKTALQHLVAKTTDERQLSALKHALENVEGQTTEQKQ